MGEARLDPDRAAGLLLKALENLSVEEREAVLRALLTGSLGALGRRVPDSPPLDEYLMVSERPLDEYLVVPERHHREVGGQFSTSRILPVRLTPDAHERLRRWSTEHGFAMAVVVRGLIERFLDERAA